MFINQATGAGGGQQKPPPTQEKSTKPVKKPK